MLILVICWLNCYDVIYRCFKRIFILIIMYLWIFNEFWDGKGVRKMNRLGKGVDVLNCVMVIR